MCEISVSIERVSAIDYSELVFVNELTSLSQSARLASRNWMVALSFSKSIWFLTVASFGTLTLFMNISTRNIAVLHKRFAFTLYQIFMKQCKFGYRGG